MSLEFKVIVGLGIFATLFLVLFILRHRGLNFKNIFCFKEPCGDLVRKDDGNVKYFNRKEAKEYAKNHPYHYVTSLEKRKWIFAETFASTNKK